MSTVIAVIATERTGSNYFCDLMIKSLDINGMYEIFNPDVAYGLSDTLIAKATGKSFEKISNLGNKEKASLVRDNPKLVLDALIKHEVRPSLFKIFPNHLSDIDVKAYILDNPEIIKVFIDRSPLDTYISQKKAGLISKWGNVDTTNVKIDLYRDQFECWFERRKKWYDFCREEIVSSEQDYAYIHYSDIESLTPMEFVDFFIQKIYELGCSLSKSDRMISDLMMKQDKNKNVQFKVENWTQFKNSFPNKTIDTHYQSSFLFN